MSNDMTWLGNVPQKHHNISAKVEARTLAELEDLLAFIQTHQPEAQLDHLVEEVLEYFYSRDDQSVPGPIKRDRLSVKIPETTYNELLRVAGDAREAHADDSIGEAEVLEHAIQTFLGRSTKLVRAWKKDRESEPEKASSEAPPRASEESGVVQAPNASDVSPGTNPTRVAEEVRKGPSSKELAARELAARRARREQEAGEAKG